MDDSGPEAGPRCLWCGQPLGEGPASRRYCARPRLCRDRAYRDRRRAKAAMPERLALARAGHRVDEQVQAIREVLLQAVLQGDAWPGVFSLAAAVLERRTQDLVRVCVIEDRAAGTTWAQVAEPFGITPDAARKRWGHWGLAHREEIPEGQENP
ncbi:hypothetical protein [Streptomyces acidiscabies]|uniref:Uncharacterized protein n=1 Tax=Streptomyces acidiscabies TaxID=42234 RepID=A0AAP6BL06_9ACTN|nr:hypothetical protein [Streptomyces acidiscabies]MBZ3918160.1 hypothetical protein [Streptomyces acidiscabies]MDX2966442.1 hypothetical protein [Streptomyces acidiscabies]MDX3796388.1 hypothetical protein [Streptomyces acidiscabies]